MTCIKLKEFLLFLILHHVCSEVLEPVFRAVGSNIEMGYCFRVDYIVVYRSTPEGDQLLVNSSNNNLPPADLQGRTKINAYLDLLGLQIINLAHLDTGIYRRECWKNHTLVNHHTQHLSVCDKEIESEEIVQKEEGPTEIRCNSTFIGHEGISLLWYFDIHPSHNQTLFLNTSVSLKPLVKDLPGVIDIRDGGSLLVLNKSVFTNNQHFHCLVTQGMKCLSFQNMYPQDSVNKDIYASLGDRVLLHCPVYGSNQYWETPLGNLTPHDSHSIQDKQMSIIAGDDPRDFSLVITDVSDHYRGPYSCISSSLEMGYILIICPESESGVKVAHIGGSVLLRCNFDTNTSEKVQWYRHDPSGQEELIFDSDDDTVTPPEDLSGRMMMSQEGYSLEITDLKIKDGRKYWCVVLNGTDTSYEYTDPKETPTEDETDKQYDAPKCVFKEDIFLNVSVKKEGGGSTGTIEPVTSSSTTRISTTAEPPAESNNTAAIVIGVVSGLVLVAAVIAAVILKKKGTNTNAQVTIQMTDTRDPDCTDRLNPNGTAD